MTSGGKPPVPIDTVHVQERRNLFQPANSHPFAQARLEHSDVAS